MFWLVLGCIFLSLHISLAIQIGGAMGRQNGARKLRTMDAKLTCTRMVSPDGANGIKSLTDDIPMIVVFGRPGAGKSTAANEALTIIQSRGTSGHCTHCVALDLDVCVPKWMRDNFNGGIYPTLEQRREFAISFCDYVDSKLFNGHIEDESSKSDIMIDSKQKSLIDAAIVSFSFVNTDLRDIFRSRFPNAAWALVDTDEAEALERIRSRKGHFYTGAPGSGNEREIKKEISGGDKKTDDNRENDNENKVEKGRERERRGGRKSSSYHDNSEWNFAPVTFPHVVLDGKAPVTSNARKVVDVLESLATRRAVESQEK